LRPWYKFIDQRKSGKGGADWGAAVGGSNFSCKKGRRERATMKCGANNAKDRRAIQKKRVWSKSARHLNQTVAVKRNHRSLGANETMRTVTFV